MSNRVKSAIALSIFVFFSLVFNGYVAWTAAPKLAPQILAYNKTHPFSPVDFGLGALAMFMIGICVLVYSSLYESDRFERDLKGGGSGSDGSGGAKRVRLPMSWKAVELEKWQPPDGHYHRGMMETSA